MWFVLTRTPLRCLLVYGYRAFTRTRLGSTGSVRSTAVTVTVHYGSIHGSRAVVIPATVRYLPVTCRLVAVTVGLHVTHISRLLHTTTTHLRCLLRFTTTAPFTPPVAGCRSAVYAHRCRTVLRLLRGCVLRFTRIYIYHYLPFTVPGYGYTGCGSVRFVRCLPLDCCVYTTVYATHRILPVTLPLPHTPAICHVAVAALLPGYDLRLTHISAACRLRLRLPPAFTFVTGWLPFTVYTRFGYAHAVYLPDYAVTLHCVRLHTPLLRGYTGLRSWLVCSWIYGYLHGFVAGCAHYAVGCYILFAYTTRLRRSLDAGLRFPVPAGLRGCYTCWLPCSSGYTHCRILPTACRLRWILGLFTVCSFGYGYTPLGYLVAGCTVRHTYRMPCLRSRLFTGYVYCRSPARYGSPMQFRCVVARSVPFCPAGLVGYACLCMLLHRCSCRVVWVTRVLPVARTCHGSSVTRFCYGYIWFAGLPATRSRLHYVYCGSTRSSRLVAAVVTAPFTVYLPRGYLCGFAVIGPVTTAFG